MANGASHSSRCCEAGASTPSPDEHLQGDLPTSLAEHNALVVDLLYGPTVDGVALLRAHVLPCLIAFEQSDRLALALEHAEQGQRRRIGCALCDRWRRGLDLADRFDRAAALFKQRSSHGVP